MYVLYNIWYHFLTNNYKNQFKKVSSATLSLIKSKMKLVLVLTTLSLVFSHGHGMTLRNRKLQEAETIIYTKGEPVPEGQEEVLRLKAPMYTNETATERAGSMVLSCPYVGYEGFQLFYPCSI